MIKWARRAIGLVLMLCLFARLLWGALQLSTTADEPSHITSGYVVLARGMAGLWTVSQRGHPLGVDAWLALPLWISQPDVPLENLAGWQTDYAAFLDSFWASLAMRDQTVFAARVQAMFFTLLLAAVVWRWGREIWPQPDSSPVSAGGAWVGLLALGALAFDPTLIAHGRLAANDVGVTALGTAALYGAWRWAGRPCWTRALGTGVLLALTMLAKGSGVLWVAAAGVAMLAVAARRWRSDHGARLLAQAIGAGLLSLLLLWAAYGFSWGPVGSHGFSLPASAHWAGILRHPQNVEERLAFALGQRTYGRWWWYFPLAFAIKNPLPLLIALAISFGVLLRQDERRRLGLLTLFPALYAAAALLVGKDIGYRYLLPIHPFLYLAIGGGLVRLYTKISASTCPGWAYRACQSSLGALALWYVAAGARVYPYEIAYFNELIGGPENGYRYLVDSNLAWGQAAGIQDAYLQTHPEVQAGPPVERYRPSPGRYIVNASYLQGVGIGDPYAYEWFRHREPSAVLDYSLLVYDVADFEVGWVARCDVPRAPLDRDAIVEGIGQDEVRIVSFDCTRGWLYPAGSSGGIYVLHHDLVQDKEGLLFASPAPQDPFIARHVASARLSFDQPTGNRGQPFVLYEAQPTDLRSGPGAGVNAGDRVPVLLRKPRDGDRPIALQGPLEFLNAAERRQGELVEVTTLWRVTDGPVARPFSIMGHLVSADGAVIAGADGLGISPLALVPGDLYVQRHRFSSVPDEDVCFQTGAYWLDTMEQWAVIDASRADALLFALS